MDMKNVINSFKLLYSMEADTTPLITQLATYCHTTDDRDLPSEDDLDALVESHKSHTMYAMKFVDEMDLPDDFEEKHLYLLPEKLKEFKHHHTILQNVHIIDERYVVCIYQVAYQYEDDDMFGPTQDNPSGKALYTGYSHWLVYVNGVIVNKDSVDKGSDYRPWYAVLLDKRVQWKRVIIGNESPA